MQVNTTQNNGHGVTITFEVTEKVGFITTLQMIDEIRGASTDAHWAGTGKATGVRYFAAKLADQTYQISSGGFDSPDAQDLKILQQAAEKAAALINKPDELHAFATATFAGGRTRSIPAYVDQYRAAQPRVVGD